MDYKIGDKVKNGAGNICTVTKSCLQCITLVGDKGKGRGKCRTRNSCPAWKDHIPEKLKKLKSYLVVYMDDTDGEPHITRMNRDQIQNYTELFGGQDDIAIIDGDLVKGFYSKTDISKL